MTVTRLVPFQALRLAKEAHRVARHWAKDRLYHVSNVTPED